MVPDTTWIYAQRPDLGVGMSKPALKVKRGSLPADFLAWLETQPHNIRHNTVLLGDKLDELILAGGEIDKWFSPFDAEMGQGIVLISDLFTCLEGQKLFRKNLQRGSFSILGEDLKQHMLAVVQHSVRLNEALKSADDGFVRDEEFRAVEDDLGSMNAIFITMLNNCNPQMKLGRKRDTTKRRAEYLDDTQSGLLLKTYHLRTELTNRGKVEKALLDQIEGEVEKLHEKYRKLGQSPWGNADFDNAFARMKQLEQADTQNRKEFKELTLCLHALHKTPRNRKKALVI